MIEGYVSDLFDPIVEIGLVAGGKATPVEAVVDTGSSGAICLSVWQFGNIELVGLWSEDVDLADGQVVTENLYGGMIVFDGVEREVEATLTDSRETLIGVELLKDRKLTIDYVARIVQIE